MINSMIETIRSILVSEFGEEDYCVYTESIWQDLNKSCFFVSCVRPTYNLVRGNQYFRENPFVIRYYSKSSDTVQNECNAVAERLFGCMEYITLSTEGKSIRGTGMNYEIVEGVLNFFVNYDCYVNKAEVTTYAMEEVQSSIKVKGGE